ncbi:MAG: S26 family signal peptidase [Phyllobacteriaceae bacterium]|nr:S26 family signal peptidase [Phyllobacteriaceae bacterium]
MSERRKRRLSAHALGNWTALGALLVGVSAADIAPTKLIWNASDSLPVGLYWVRNRSAQRGNLVLVRLPKNAGAFAADRRILPADTPALKRVAALKGDRVCRFGQAVSVNGEPVARARWSDGLGRRMPVWSGCRVLTGDEVFLLTDHPRSFDGRYFGVTQSNRVIGAALPLWTFSSSAR